MNFQEFEDYVDKCLQDAYNDQMIEVGKHWEQSMAERDEAQWEGDCFKARELYKFLNLEVEKLYQQDRLDRNHLESLLYETLIIDKQDYDYQKLRKQFRK